MLPPDVDGVLLEATELIKHKMNRSVLEIATENAEDYMWTDDFPGEAAVITLLDVALSSQHRWDVVFSTLQRFSEEFRGCTLAKFPDVVRLENKRKFVERWFFEDLKLFTSVEKLASRFLRYKDKWVLDTEMEAMAHWAKKYRESDGWPDPSTSDMMKGVQAFGIVDVQYLIMRLGVSTVRPDDRLKLVFKNLDIPFKDEKDLVMKGHELADMLNIEPLVLDQLFW